MTTDFYQTNPDAVSLTEQNLTKFAYGIQNNYYPLKAFLGLFSSVNSFYVTSKHVLGTLKSCPFLQYNSIRYKTVSSRMSTFPP